MTSCPKAMPAPFDQDRRSSAGIRAMTSISVWLVFVWFGAGALPAQDSSDAGTILDSSAFPWFNAETESARPIPFEARPESRAADRHAIPEYIPRNSKPKTGMGGARLPAGANGDFSLLFWLLVALVLVFILGLMVWAFLKLESRNQQSIRSEKQRSLAESIEQLPFQLDDQTGDFRTLAQRAYQAGDFRRATIYLYSHMLVVLDQAGLIRLKKGKTNRHYFREVSQQSQLGPYFLQTMELFESVFFGDHEITQEGFETCWQQLPAFLAEMERKLATRGEVALEG